MHIIGISGAAGSGKSTIAQNLVENHGFVRVRFAGPLKAMLAALGLSADEIDGNLKETPCALLGGTTPRYAMQALGTEWGRDLIDHDVWVNAWKRSLESAGDKIVSDDVRFVNETIAIWDLGGYVLNVIRPSHGRTEDRHASESQELEYNVRFVNDGSKAKLLAEVDQWLA